MEEQLRLFHFQVIRCYKNFGPFTKGFIKIEYDNLNSFRRIHLKTIQILQDF